MAYGYGYNQPYMPGMMQNQYQQRLAQMEQARELRHSSSCTTPMAQWAVFLYYFRISLKYSAESPSRMIG